MRAAGTRFGVGQWSAWGAGVLLALWLCPSACIGGQTGSEIGKRSSGDPRPGIAQPMNPIVGECRQDSDCVQRAQKLVARLRVPRAAPRLVAAGCETGAACAPACMCWIGREGGGAIDASSFDSGACLAVGAEDACLWQEQSPCTPGPCACAAQCAGLVTRIAADEAAAAQAAVHVARCKPAKCEIAIKLGERCYTGELAARRTEVDCATLAPLSAAARSFATNSTGGGVDAPLACGADGSVLGPDVPDGGLEACFDDAGRGEAP